MVDSITSYIIDGFVISSDMLPHFDKNNKCNIRDESDSDDECDRIEHICTQIADDICRHIGINIDIHIEPYDDDPPMSHIIGIGINDCSDIHINDPYTTWTVCITDILKNSEPQEKALEYLRTYLNLSQEYKRKMYSVSSVCLCG